MADTSHKGLFFAATVLMCGVMFYGSQLASADPQSFEGTRATALPRQLTLPPGVKSEIPPELSLDVAPATDPCAHSAGDASCAEMPSAKSATADAATVQSPVKAEPIAVTNVGEAAGAP